MSQEKTIKKILQEITKINEIKFETPKDPQFGDIAFPCFSLSKDRKQSPIIIAKELEEEFKKNNKDETIIVEAKGPYLNFKIDDKELNSKLIEEIITKEKIIKPEKKKEKVLIESPGPNTNKPLHLGHLRNILLGKTIYKLLELNGKDTHMVNVINDRGIHICKSMLAYQKWGENKTPEESGMKGDHFVGHWYVKFSQEASKDEKRKKELEEEAQEMLIRWEEGDETVLKLWNKMNKWVYEGFEETYKELNFKIEKNYYESATYKGGKEIIEEGVKKKIFYKDETGATIVDLENKKLGKKVLLRSDNTSVYITQDINMANLRYKDYKFNEMIYIVGNEQEYHFKVLFEIFKLLEWPFANNCKHYSYGMIELPEGKMKSREGNVIDTDDLLKNMKQLSEEEIKKRYPQLEKNEIKKRADMIAKGAIYFFFLKQDPVRNFVFDPKKSLSFEGETGPYVQYTHARICSIIRKSEIETKKDNFESLTLLTNNEEKQLIKELKQFKEIIAEAGNRLKPSLITNYLLTLSQSFNNYYSKHRVIQENKKLEEARILLLKAVKKTIKEGLEILDIKAPEKM